MGHENAEGMAHVGVRVERTVRPGPLARGDGVTMVLHFTCQPTPLVESANAICAEIFNPIASSNHNH